MADFTLEISELMSCPQCHHGIHHVGGWNSSTMEYNLTTKEWLTRIFEIPEEERWCSGVDDVEVQCDNCGWQGIVQDTLNPDLRGEGDDDPG